MACHIAKTADHWKPQYSYKADKLPKISFAIYKAKTCKTAQEKTAKAAKYGYQPYMPLTGTQHAKQKKAGGEVRGARWVVNDTS